MLVTYSFIVPVYNCASYLSACISSILNQRFEDYELLLIDDGSTDNSGALCDSFASRYAQIHAFHKANGGAADARNYGLERANGSFILFIDGDDTVSPNYLEQIRPRKFRVGYLGRVFRNIRVGLSAAGRGNGLQISCKFSKLFNGLCSQKTPASRAVGLRGVVACVGAYADEIFK